MPGASKKSMSCNLSIWHQMHIESRHWTAYFLCAQEHTLQSSIKHQLNGLTRNQKVSLRQKTGPYHIGHLVLNARLQGPLLCTSQTSSSRRGSGARCMIARCAVLLASSIPVLQRSSCPSNLAWLLLASRYCAEQVARPCVLCQTAVHRLALTRMTSCHACMLCCPDVCQNVRQPMC